MALSNEYAKLMKGKLSFEGQLGQGSTFSFFFPGKKEVIGMVIQEEAIEENNQMFNTIASSSIPANIENEKKSTILVVEDNKDLREFIHILLAPHYNVVLTENGKKALEQLNHITPDLILSDMMMPEMDGMQLLAHLKSDEKYKYYSYHYAYGTGRDER